MSTPLAVAALLTVGGPASADEMKLPPLKRRKTPQAVVDEHLDVLNKCDWNRLMTQMSTGSFRPVQHERLVLNGTNRPRFATRLWNISDEPTAVAPPFAS